MSNLTVSGDFSSAGVGFDLPYSDGLVGLHFFGNSMAASRRNLAPGGFDLRTVGTPVLGGNFVSCGSGASGTVLGGFQTAIPGTPTMTFIAAARTPVAIADDAHVPVLVGQHDAVTGQYAVISSAAALTVSAMFGNGERETTAGTVLGAWRMMAVTFSPIALKAYDFTGSSVGSLVTNATLLPNTAAPLEIGTFIYGRAAGATRYAGQIDLAWAAIYSGVARTQAELTAIYAAVKPALAARSVLV